MDPTEAHVFKHLKHRGFEFVRYDQTEMFLWIL